MTVDEVIQEHVDACEETYVLMLEENRVLKYGKADFPEEHMQKKAGLLARLEKSVQGLKALNARASLLGPRSEAVLQVAHKKLMKTLALDKENDRLFSEVSFRRRTTLSNPVVAPAVAKSAYGQYMEQNSKPL